MDMKRYMDYEKLTTVSGQWTMKNGKWTMNMDMDKWTMEIGQQIMVMDMDIRGAKKIKISGID